jgi:predicted deacylase
VTRPYEPYVAAMEQTAKRCGMAVRRYGEVAELGRSLPLLCLELPGGAPETVITSGFHGEEPAGPLTILERLPDLVKLARSLNVALRIYPCVNPSGFELGTRYNASQEKPNNDLLRYEVPGGAVKGELADGEGFVRWFLHTGGPKETRLLAADLDARPAPASALDVHQDNYLPGAFTYAYVFGAFKSYLPLVREAEKAVPVAKGVLVDETHRTDENGLVVFHDGSVTDYYHRRGVPFTAALETTTRTPMPAAHDANFAWMKGFVELAAAQRQG